MGKTTSRPREVSPGIATPPRPNMGWGAEEVVFRCSNNVGSVASSWGACLFNRGPVARPPIKAARDIGAGDDGAVCGRREDLPTSFWRVSVCSPWRTVLELVELGTSEERETVEEVSKRVSCPYIARSMLM